jgi:hypothetical protein
MMRSMPSYVLIASAIFVTLHPVAARAQCFYNNIYTCSESTTSGSAPVLELATDSTYAAIDVEQTTGGSAIEGYGAVGVWGESNAAGGIGVFGENTNTNNVANNYGIYGSSAGPNGFGVYGYNGSSNLSAHGVHGSAPNGTGVYGAGIIGVYAYGTSSSPALNVYSYQQSASNPGLYVTGTTALDGQVQVNGSGTYTGTWQQQSDARLKKDVLPLKESLQKLLELRGVSYEWREPAMHGDLRGPQVGLIAQEVEKVFPEWVGSDRNGYKAISTDAAFASVAVEATRELWRETQELASEAHLLEARVKSVEDASMTTTATVAPPTRSGRAGAVAVFCGLILGVAAGRLLASRREQKET